MGSKLTIQEVKERIVKIHGDNIVLDENTYVDVVTKCRFIHKVYGVWWATPDKIFRGRSHPDGKVARTKKHFVEKFGFDHPNKNESVKQKMRLTKTIPAKQISVRLFNIYGNEVIMDETTYKNSRTKCRFIHVIHGEWWTTPNRIFSQGSLHPDGKIERSKKTCLKKYGFDNPQKNQVVALKTARSSNKSTIKHNWNTGNEIVCVGSYESKSVDYLNINKINYDWQSQVFTLPDGRTYRPDLYLVDEGIWVEIKGFMRGDAEEKWNWFKTQFPTAELWNEKKLKEMGIL